MNKNSLLPLYLLALSSLGITGYAQTVAVSFGSALTPSFDTASIFTNEAKIGYDSTNTALFSLGYFADGFDVATEVSNITDSASLTNFLGNFTPIVTDNFSNATAPGFLVSGNGNMAETGVGKDSYLMSLGGVTDFANGGNATEIGLFRDTATFGTIPAGSDVPPTDYNIVSLTYDTVLLGTEHLGETLTGAFAGVTGNIYASQAIGQAVPEPSTYALFFGIFSIGFVYWRKRTSKTVSQG